MENINLPQNSIEFLSQAEEGHYFDRKSARKDVVEIARHIIAFANAAGGKLAIGVEDDGTVTGFKRDGAHAIEDFEQIPITFCSPTPIIASQRIPVTNVKGENDLVLLLDINASSDRVISRRTDDAVFLRENDKSVKLDYDQTRALAYDKNEQLYEDEPVRKSSFEDVDLEEVERYKKLVGATVSAEQLLKSREFMSDSHLTVAGAILFAKRPTRFFPSARVRVIKIDGVKRETGTRLNVVKDLTFEGPLPRVVRETKETISHMLRDFYVLGKDGRFEEIPEYPEFAWFEGLINAVTHRDYANHGEHIRVSIFEDRMEILSPGKLPNMVTLENMRTTRHSRNPRIARTLVDFGWVREFNEGIGRMYEAMQELSLPDPIYEEHSKAVVILTLENNIAERKHYEQNAVTHNRSDIALSSYTENERVALQYAADNGKITRKELANELSKTGKTATQILTKLADQGVLVWNGSSKTDPTGYYTINEV